MRFMQNADNSAINEPVMGATAEDWIKDFDSLKNTQGKALHITKTTNFHYSNSIKVGEESENYNTQFWNRLQDEWKNMSKEGEQQHPWMSDFNDYHDPYKVEFLI